MTSPPTWPGQPTRPDTPPRAQQPPRPQPPTRPVDVDTGFWLWVAALPLMVVAYGVDLVASRPSGGSAMVYVASGLFIAVLCAIVLTFLLLMRVGYRWARTLLTGGGVAAVVYVAIRVFTIDRSPLVAITCAVTGIVGSVLIAGGVFLLHRKDGHGYFTK